MRAGLTRGLLFGGVIALIGVNGGLAATMPEFEGKEIDSDVNIGYGINLSDVNADGKRDILLVDKNTIAWYQNPTWKKHVIAKDLTERDHVCIAARDINADDHPEVAIGAQWKPWDTVNSGAIFYLKPPQNRTKLWEPMPLPNDPVIHRMRWVRKDRNEYFLVPVPLHGLGNEDGQGAGVRILAYQKPDDPRATWTIELVNGDYHMTHNIDPVQWDDDITEEILLASREGLFLFDRSSTGWEETQFIANDGEEGGFPGASEIRLGRLPENKRFLASVEPFHGHQVVTYTAPEAGEEFWERKVVDDSLKAGHAVACGDFMDAGYDQLVVGWRDENADGKVGIKLYVPGPDGKQWRRSWVDNDQMACEDVRLADLNDDGKLDIVASGRATHNLKIYWNKG